MLTVVKSIKSSGDVRVKVQTAIPIPASFAFAAVERILKEFTVHPGSASLALNMRDLRAPFEALLSVPIAIGLRPGLCRNEWRLEIEAAANDRLYPKFHGVLTLIPAPGSGSQLELSGTYSTPLGSLGRAVDNTALKGVATASLQRFVREVGARVASLANWAQFT